MTARVLGLGLAVFCACVASAKAEDIPRWLVEAKARESRLSDFIEVSSTDGWLRTKLPSTVKEKIALDDDAYQVAIQLDGSGAVSCEVLKGTHDLASLLSKTSAMTFDALKKVNGAIEFRAVEKADAGSLQAIPFMMQQWIYRANLNGERRVGELKQFVAALDQATVYCAHDELGYAKTFDTLARTFTANLQITGDPLPQPYFRDVSVMSIDGARVGVATTTMTKDADGDTKIVSVSSMLIQTMPGQLAAQDAYQVEWVRSDGSLINAVRAKSGNGEVNEAMALKQIDGRWKASGTIEGKAIDVELPTAPSSFMELIRARRQLMAQAQPEGTKTEAMAWTSPDLTRLTPVSATLLKPEGNDGFGAREELAGVSLMAVLDKQTGTMISARFPMGPRMLTVERVYRQGGF